MQVKYRYQIQKGIDVLSYPKYKKKDIEVSTMTKKEYCTTHDVKAVYSTGLSGISIHGIESGIEDYIYWSESHEVTLWDTNNNGYPEFKQVTTYHKSLLKTTITGNYYFISYGKRVSLDDCLIVWKGI